MLRRFSALAALALFGLAGCSANSSAPVAQREYVAEPASSADLGASSGRPAVTDVPGEVDRSAFAPAAHPLPFAEESRSPQLSGAATASTSSPSSQGVAEFRATGVPPADPEMAEGRGPGMGGDRFDRLPEQDFIPVHASPLSTFSIDVDTAAYSKVRTFLQQRQLPPVDAVRIEELINYFPYGYSTPQGPHPFSVQVEVADAPWQPRHKLARIGIKGRELSEERPDSNLVFLIDVSGSMSGANRLPLVKQGLQMLTRQLTPKDRVAIVVYASAAGLVLPSTPGDRGPEILAALEQLQAGGSTNGGQGIQLAYQVARQNFIPGGVNRVLLCTDGDFNVGVTSTGDLVQFAEQEARQNVFLTVLGFGMGNHNDAMLEQLSNKANGTYAFIDSLSEARKVLVDQLGGTLFTIAKDVKLQVEFNPAHVSGYRLIGYENRQLANRDFNDDRKDAGDIGAGHTVTALYELIPADHPSEELTGTVDPLKYQARENTPATDRAECLTVKLRYKQPDGQTSQLLEVPVAAAAAPFETASPDFRFAASVAAFGMLLRKSQHAGEISFTRVRDLAAAARGGDPHGYRGEFLELVDIARELAGEPGERISWQPGYGSWARPPQPVRPPQTVRYRPAPVITLVRPYVADSPVATSHRLWLVVAIGLHVGLILLALHVALVLIRCSRLAPAEGKELSWRRGG